MKKRLTICVFWDKEGVLRDYALFYIKALKEFSYRFLVVVNGLIADDAKKTLEELGCEVIKGRILLLILVHISTVFHMLVSINLMNLIMLS